MDIRRKLMGDPLEVIVLNITELGIDARDEREEHMLPSLSYIELSLLAALAMTPPYLAAGVGGREEEAWSKDVLQVDMRC
ncbi:hypothetical protein E2C01_023708 [Portunus trituberculatus]|uniref:Uncharacterized protein n=1 Tax=Portunus trituberculatus TaxID=210409 RepID=A0A5B7EBV5_PORTR|nr:hypothetical protein [Portunus trituberculatus]